MKNKTASLVKVPSGWSREPSGILSKGFADLAATVYPDGHWEILRTTDLLLVTQGDASSSSKALLEVEKAVGK